MKITGAPADILQTIDNCFPDVDMKTVLRRVERNIPFIKRQVALYQGSILVALASKYNKTNCLILEIGSAWGYSAACMAEGAPLADITTLNPKKGEYSKAKENLRVYKNVGVYQQTSMEFWERVERTEVAFDLIFVDGDHTKIEQDLIWWERLKKGGLFLFHDYSPDGSGRPCREVYSALNDWIYEKGLSFNVEVVDDKGVGMVGVYK